MSFVSGLMGLLKGDFAKNAMTFVNTRWPPDMSEAQKANMTIVIKELTHRQAMELADVAQADEAAFNERTIKMEGTAADLKGVKVLGPIVIFLRGAFRPLFSYMVGYFDFGFFTTDTTDWSEQKMTLLIILNILVIGFYFGERLLKNVMPLITRMLEAKGAVVLPPDKL